MLKCKPVPSISSKSLLQPEQFLLLVVACLAGSYLAGCLVYFWFVVEIQWRKSSEVKDVGGVKRTFYTIIHGLPTGLL